ncbi:MAG: T9SS type A sorting domain-containing protein [Candidatus Eisenbacteria bacterium]|uniref:T9SS type A sorting domain-containing protein n=1 Tax=Eiseniibacteriota bacterium TaxID=2212470 RepID=A0A948RS13_UNCEI|nr:T9SS type A sorting domain-containing protein [Candidatus Eisenbacteria bacterium]MBU1949506.1 T9SS type A sorting domain-containing protein [Candidatus Eisenbacteria bacterium]MBU2689943.1 T9SS type A sorting domain-containing protein [Candidatus Eisenbacteria bacterium]
MYWWAVASHAYMSDGIGHFQACYSSACPPISGCDALIKIVGTCYGNESSDNVAVVWGGLDGNDGIPRRVLGEAIKHVPNPSNFQLVGDHKKTAAPAFKHVDGEWNNSVPWDGLEIRFTCDTHLNTSMNAEDVLQIPGNIFYVDGAVWEGDTVIVANVKPLSGQFGSEVLRVLSSEVVSQNNSHLHLDGDGRDGPNDYRMRLIHGDDPAADVGGIRVEDGRFYFRPVTEHETAGYLIQSKAGDSWTTVAELEPGVGERSHPVGGGEYRLVEVETSGNEIIHSIAKAEDIPTIEPQIEPGLEEMRSLIQEKLLAGPPSDWFSGQHTMSGEKLGIICWEPLVMDYQYLADVLSGWYGVETTVIGVPGPNLVTFEGVKAVIAGLYGDGVRYALLGGDWSDWEYFAVNGPYTSETWVDTWAPILQDYYNSGFPEYGDPDNAIIPARVLADPRPRGQNMSWHRPYLEEGDMFSYGDVDDDGLPDVAVGRLPFTTNEQVLGYVWKAIYYIDVGGWGYDEPYTTSWYIGDLDHDQPGEGQFSLEVAEQLQAAFPTGTTIFPPLYESQYGGWDRIQAAVDLWNYQNELVMFVGTLSNRSRPADFFKLPLFTMDLIWSGSWTPVVLGLSCGIGDFARTMDPYYGIPVFERKLGTWDKGAVAEIGPSTGTWQQGNLVVGLAIVQFIMEDPSRPLGESVRLALRYVLENADPEEDSDVILTARSYQFHGLPLLPLNHINYVVGVNDRGGSQLKLALNQNIPNPFNPRTSIGFSLTAPGLVDMSVVDVSGRVVRTLVEGQQEAGQHIVIWDGRTNSGHEVSSGVYFLRMTAEGRLLKRMMHLLK